MLKALVASFAKSLRAIEDSSSLMVFFYGMVGYFTVHVIALTIKCFVDNLFDPMKVVLFILAYGVLGFIYYTRYIMILEDSKDDDC